MTKLDGNYYPQLTGIRAIAAFMVFFFHFNPFHEGFIFHFVNEFHVGVTVFFVLSGFLITYRYIDSFEFSREWFSKYIINRVARIYPMYILITICAFIFAPDIVKTVPIFILNIT
ncbi:MAG: acyltransferase, partial [Bacteroidetes bacterium]